MQLKTVSSIGLAFLLVVGVVGVASAQEVAGTQGICNSRLMNRTPDDWAQRSTDKISHSDPDLRRTVLMTAVSRQSGFRDSAVADDS